MNLIVSYGVSSLFSAHLVNCSGSYRDKDIALLACTVQTAMTADTKQYMRWACVCLVRVFGLGQLCCGAAAMLARCALQTLPCICEIPHTIELSHHTCAASALHISYPASCSMAHLAHEVYFWKMYQHLEQRSTSFRPRLMG